MKGRNSLLSSAPCDKWSVRLGSGSHLKVWVASSNGWPQGVQWRENQWTLGRRKVMEAFARSRWGVRNENKAYRALNRVLSDCWFSHGLLEFTQACEMGARVAKWFLGLRSIFAKQSNFAWNFCKANVGVQIFRTPCELIFGIFVSPTKFSQGVRNALFFLHHKNF